mmetsp:Transcript_139204/g.444895  ORF Transcript_139204/g.444895 Transcript_139204/m.444895 type:complete len:174 (-) Transcript_139204:112-633(-)
MGNKQCCQNDGDSMEEVTKVGSLPALDPEQELPVVFGDADPELGATKAEDAPQRTEPALPAILEAVKEDKENKPPASQPASGSEFSVMLRRVGGKKEGDLGITLAREGAAYECLKVLKVSGGLIETWNQAHPDLAVKDGDFVMEVNGLRQNGNLMLVGLASEISMVLRFCRAA